MRFVFVENFHGKTVTPLELLQRGGYFFLEQQGEEVVYLYSRRECSSDDSAFLRLLATYPLDIRDYRMNGQLVPFDCGMHREDGSLDMQRRPQQFYSQSGIRTIFGWDVHVEDAESIRITQAVEAERVRLLKEMGEWPVVAK